MASEGIPLETLAGGRFALALAPAIHDLCRLITHWSRRVPGTSASGWYPDVFGDPVDGRVRWVGGVWPRWDGGAHHEYVDRSVIPPLISGRLAVSPRLPLDVVLLHHSPRGGSPNGQYLDCCREMQLKPNWRCSPKLNFSPASKEDVGQRESDGIVGWSRCRERNESNQAWGSDST
jgi:hypothetical protein